MKKQFTILLFSLAFCTCLLTIGSCSPSPLRKLVGNDRDDHGCLRSAGYQWSYALNDCVRIWEKGERFEANQNNVFLIFSSDSLFAEIFAEDGKHIICKRKKKNNCWLPPRGEERVTIANGVTIVHINHFDYTKSVKK